MDFAHTRQENDSSLLTRLDAIRAGEALDVLEPFAKAYLGLFYDIDSRVSPEQRIELLANTELAAAIKQGTVALLQRDDLPGPALIARAMHKQETLPVGFVVLAGMGLIMQQQPEQLGRLPKASLQAALVFHHSLSTFHQDDWYEELLQTQPALVAEALLAMWQALIEENVDFLPGLHGILQGDASIPVFKELLIPLLGMWQQCRTRELLQLLTKALQYTDHAQLLVLAKKVLSDDGDVLLRNQVYWHTTAFMLNPVDQGQILINFMGQEKIKLLPMLDFVMLTLDRKDTSVRLPAMGYAYLIRCLAQKFTPQEDMHGNLAEISMKVLWLFYQLACCDAEQGGEALKWLQRVRVLKLYSDVFDHIAALQQVENKPDFQSFVKQLRDEGRLRKKKNWHDIK